MLRIETRTKLSPEKAIEGAVSFFGPGGYGLTVNAKGPCCVEFEGAGGGVEVTTSADGSETKVELLSREWDNQAKEFIRWIGGGGEGKEPVRGPWQSKEAPPPWT
ncbi:MAG: hypothetical protein HYX92_15380 [Chloroflexi bacterium]|nr:hypothetical protein [Chloroflexota bacterium]